MKFQLLASTLLLLSVSCAPRGPIVDTGEKPPGVGGTIAGQVLTGGGRTPLASRKVAAVNTMSGQRYEASTAANGGYTIKVPPGTYRLEVETRPNEVVVTQPEPTEVNPSDVDSDRDFVLMPRPA
jgi:Carboxypeptidase regulatory-like domain